MKFRKVCKDKPTSGGIAGPWTKSNTSGNRGCAIMKVKSLSQGRLPVKEEDTEKIEQDVDLKRPGTNLNMDSESMNQLSISKVEDDEVLMQEDEEQAVKDPVVPKAKELQYVVSEKGVSLCAMKLHRDLSMQGKDKHGNTYTGQIDLLPAGILSLEDVILPSMGATEMRALKRLQAKAQRHNPDQVPILVAARAAVRDSINSAIKAAESSRAQRGVFDEQREQVWAEQRHAKREENREARAQAVEDRRAEEVENQKTQNLKEKRDHQKKFQPNQELWREVAYLMTESSKLERESRLWKEAETVIDARQKEMDAREANHVQEMKLQQEEGIHPDTATNEEAEDQVHSMDTLHKSTEDVITSSNDIQAALKLVTNLMLDSAKLRKDLYRRYRQDHQFEGYRGVNDPKGLIRILSQDDA